MDLINPPLDMIFCINSGKGSALYSSFLVIFFIIPVLKSISILSPDSMLVAASSHSKIGRPIFIAFL